MEWGYSLRRARLILAKVPSGEPPKIQCPKLSGILVTVDFKLRVLIVDDEEEIRDNIDEDPPLITVQFEIKILCAKEILLKDGT